MKLKLNLSALAVRDFRRYLAANACSLWGVWIQRITVAWIAWDLTGSATFVGIVAFLGFAPTLVAGPVFGVIADRVPLIRAAQAVQISLWAIALAMAALHAAGRLDPPILASLAALIGLVTSAHHPVRLSLAPLLVPRSAISSVVTCTSLNFNLARSVAPALGGVLIAAFGAGTALWVIVASYLPYILVLPSLTPRARDTDGDPSGTRRRSILGGLADGARLAFRTPLIRDAMAATAIFALIGRGVLEILPVVADGVFGRGAAGLGTLTSAAGIGALVASAALAAAAPATAGARPVAGEIAAATGIALAMILVLLPSWPLAVVAVAALGGAGAVVGVSMQSAIQLVAPDGYRGRIMSLWIMTGIGGASAGALLLGALADRVGLVAGCLWVGGTGLALSLVLGLRPRR